MQTTSLRLVSSTTLLVFNFLLILTETEVLLISWFDLHLGETLIFNVSVLISFQFLKMVAGMLETFSFLAEID